MISDMMRSICLCTLVSLLSWYCPGLQAQSTTPTDAVDEGESKEDASTLDLFDEDTELTKTGWTQLNISAGYMYLDGDGRFAARLPDGREIPIINFERAGLKDTDSSYWLSINWRSAHSRWGAWFGSWRYDVTGSRVWGTSLPIDDTEIPVGASVTSDFDATWYILEATFSFYRSETIDTGIGFGLHTVDLDTTIIAEFEIGDQKSKITSSSLDTIAPLPNVLAYLHWKFATRWNFTGRIGYFGLDYSDYSGEMTNAHAMVNFELSRRWALGLGYQFVSLDLDIEKPKKGYTQVYDIDFSGPMMFAKFSF